MTNQSTIHHQGAAETMLQVELVYALPDKQFLKRFKVKQGSTIAEAIEISGIRDEIRSIEIKEKQVGIFGKLVKLDDEIKAGDRIEIYRPLAVDPKERRKRKAAETNSQPN